MQPHLGELNNTILSQVCFPLSRPLLLSMGSLHAPCLHPAACLSSSCLDLLHLYWQSAEELLCVTTLLILQGLDRVIAQASAHGIRVILTLTNYWPDYGGPPTWAKWFNRSSIVEFYQDPAIRWDRGLASGHRHLMLDY